MQDNFDLIVKFLEGTVVMEKNDFFFVQILKRRKDNPEMTEHEINIDNIYITSFKDFKKKKDRIVKTCEVNNARCLIRLGKRNFEFLSTKLVQEIGSIQEKKAFHKIVSAFTSVCGSYPSSKKKLWMIDVDDMTIYEEVKTLLENITKIHLIVPSKTGAHIVINGFNPDLWPYPEKDPRVGLMKEATTNLIC